ncbi:hypothetical protein [Herbidospora sp. RD11066]
MLRLLITAALVMAGASAAGGEKPKNPWPEAWIVVATMCGYFADEDRCPEGEATLTQAQKVRAALTADPRVTEAWIEDGRELAQTINHDKLWTNGVDRIEDRTRISISTFSDDGMFLAVEARVADRADLPGVEADAGELPGVDVVRVDPAGFWSDRIDLYVSMCGDPAKEHLACKGRGAATRAEKDAVAAHLRGLPGDPVVYEQTPAHNLWESRIYWDRLERSGHFDAVEADFTPMFYVDLADTTNRIDILYRAIGLPGVLEVGIS